MKIKTDFITNSSSTSFTITNITAQNTATVTANSETTATSDVEEILLRGNQSYKYITCEKDYVKMDGSFSVAPLSTSCL